jgi:hypothetical protein
VFINMAKQTTIRATQRRRAWTKSRMDDDMELPRSLGEV